MLVIVHSGQTGVERGAHRGALAAGLPIAGFMSLERRDELGPIPEEVAAYLTPCFERGPRPAIRANVALASGALVLVPDRARADRVVAMPAVLQALRSAHVPSLVCDASTNLDDIVKWVRALPETSGSTRVLVTGPRATRWADGEMVGRRIVNAIGLT